MRLNKTTSHAIRILIECARSEGKLIKSADLSARLEITLQNVFKIVHLLSHADLIVAQRGPSGGVALARPVAEISIGDILRAMEATEIEVGVDGDPSNTTGLTIRGVNRVLDDALEAFISVLDRHTLADMVGTAPVKIPTSERDEGEAATTEPARRSTRRDKSPVRPLTRD